MSLDRERIEFKHVAQGGDALRLLASLIAISFLPDLGEGDSYCKGFGGYTEKSEGKKYAKS